MRYTIEESAFSHFLTADTRSSWLWLVVRLYVGWEWLHAGWLKVNNPLWSGSEAGGAITGFVNGALKKTAEFCPPAPAACHPDVQGWYAAFLENVVLPNAGLWSNLVAWGELAVGIALILGLFVGLAALAGAFMNLNYLLAGTVSANPIFLMLGIGLILSWRVAGWIGLDRYVLPRLSARFRPKITNT